MIEEQGERFHQDIQCMEKCYVLVDYFWKLKKDTKPASKSKGQKCSFDNKVK